MNRLLCYHPNGISVFGQFQRKYSVKYSAPKELPPSADVVIIGGGSAGCHSLYHLAKRGVKTLLLERYKLTAGTTWHTAGLLWRLRPNDVDIQLLNRSRDMLIDIKENTEYDPGWDERGGLFIARNKTRLDEYTRLLTIGKAMGIDSSILSSNETKELFPLLNPKSFIASLYSPGDGNIDPSMLCNALTKLAIQTGNAEVAEDCPVTKILSEDTQNNVKKIIGIQTDRGVIETGCVVNATGVWGRDLIEPFGITLPIVPMRHSYIVSETIDDVQGRPNLRDHDASIYFRIQGSSICMGGYERNPIILDRVAKDFNFGLYDLDWSTFEGHVKGAEELCPAFARAGIRSTICGPEAFTPDHKPIMGPDSRLIGLFHNCGFNSAGMMFGGGCGAAIAEWIIYGRPDLHMSDFDIRRFTPEQLRDKKWAVERSHESYAENYSMVFPSMQPLAGRNFKKDPLHDEMILNGAYMEEKHGYERPGFFYKEKAPFNVQPYDWYGSYGHAKNSDKSYRRLLRGDEKYDDFSDHHEKIGVEARSCRNAAAIFNLSYFCKFFVDGQNAKEAMDWICTADLNKPPNSIIYTGALNDRGGVEADLTVNILKSGKGDLLDPKFDGNVYYVVAGAASAHHTITHFNEAIADKKFDARIRNVTDDVGVISVQGPKSRKIVENLVGTALSSETIPPYTSTAITWKDPSTNDEFTMRILRTSFVGELGYELHIERDKCARVYNYIMDIGSSYGLQNAGWRALYSLSCEKGYHLWGYDLRADDTMIESNLGLICRMAGTFKGGEIVEKQRQIGVQKRLVYLTLDTQLPLYGLEGVYRNGEAVGYIRRGEYGYFIEKPIGKAIIHRKDGRIIDNEYLKMGSFEIDVLGKRYAAKLHLKLPFDPTNQRIQGFYY